MILNINSPAYYTNVFGVDDAVNDYFKKLAVFFRDKNYGQTVNTIGIVPIIAPKNEIEKGLWKEYCKVDVKYDYASISLQIDYDKYIGANEKGKIELLRDNIDKSINKISRKANINYIAFMEDLLSIEI